MNYTFNLLGISPILSFFNKQQEILGQKPGRRVEYLGSHKCTLDAFLDCVEKASTSRGWQVDEALNTVIDFWMKNSETVEYWRERLKDAGKENLLVGRVGDIASLQATFESLLDENK
ncbi:MAG TPA: hypothetical protein V6D13_12110 [Halomicronema sp.]